MNIKVADMNCKNCAARIDRELLMHGIKGKITLENKTITVKEHEKDVAVEAIKKAGYTPTV